MGILGIIVWVSRLCLLKFNGYGENQPYSSASSSQVEYKVTVKLAELGALSMVGQF
jgi:hypothetical protein